jgi:hypothetical protein
MRFPREVRAKCNPLILHLEVLKGRMVIAPFPWGSKMCAQKYELVSAIQCVTRELTPDPRGSGED